MVGVLAAVPGDTRTGGAVIIVAEVAVDEIGQRSVLEGHHRHVVPGRMTVLQQYVAAVLDHLQVATRERILAVVVPACQGLDERVAQDDFVAVFAGLEIADRDAARFAERLVVIVIRIAAENVHDILSGTEPNVPLHTIGFDIDFVIAVTGANNDIAGFPAGGNQVVASAADRGQRTGELRVANVEKEKVVTVAAVEQDAVLARAHAFVAIGIQVIVPVFAIGPVIARAAGDRVIAQAAINDVIAEQSVDIVVPAAAIDRIAAGCAHQIVGVGRSIDGLANGRLAAGVEPDIGFVECARLGVFEADQRFEIVACSGPVPVDLQQGVGSALEHSRVARRKRIAAVGDAGHVMRNCIPDQNVTVSAGVEIGDHHGGMSNVYRM